MLTQEKLKEKIVYFPNTGKFHNAKTGREVGTADKRGYVKILVNGKSYRAHRLAWLYVHGNFPKNEIDHIDGDRSNNKLKNLRDVTRAVNCMNMPKTDRNTTGFKGVDYFKPAQLYRSRIVKDGKRLFLGYFKTPEEAYKAYCDAGNLHHGDNFHPG